ncbi:rhomboid family intramembrane serine protease [Rhizobium sp. BK251]|uniref:rhomboid family intramembrane serine protease n=1 Tax=Rhizobium sp. BK251 TaxID=2512125 RepID=UPI001044CF53|nr:rhomboid family intramembrane serine protease [Rhizobium sp. BK251]TCL72645.1 membrane associated rhomboid family serine protease [Rhizobium sp. BK251]
MFIPLHDTNSLKHIRLQYVTLALIGANIVIWFLTGVIATVPVYQAAVVGLGYIPAVAFDYAELAPGLAIVPEAATYVTYSFLHTGFFHLAGNMLFLWVFGDNVEDAMGHLRFLVFYLLCAVAAALFHGLLGPVSEAPLVGASGAVSGVVTAYLMLHPRVRVWVLVFFRIPLPLPAFIPLLLWIGQQFLMLLIDRGGDVSWGAHAGGIIAGAVLVLVLRRPGVPLFDRRLVTPRAAQVHTST